MPGSSNKVITLFDRDLPAKPAIDPLRALQVAKWSRWRAAAAAQDTVCGASRRVVFALGHQGSNTTHVPATVTDGSSAGPTYADWRTLALPRVRVVPGTYLEFYVLYIPSGMTVVDTGGANFQNDGARGRVRVTVDYTLDAAANNDNRKTVQLQGSGLDLGDWERPPHFSLLEVTEKFVLPASLTTDIAVGEAYAEWCHADVTVEASGGFRIVDLVIYERPWYHAQDDAAIDQSCHAYITGGLEVEQPQTPGPQTRAADGATYTERRFGVSKMEEVARRQNALLGPLLFSWTAYTPDDSDVTTATQRYLSTNSTSLHDIFDSGHTAWSADHPGWLIDGGAHHLPWAQNDPTYAADGGNGIIPVTVEAYVHVENVAATGTLRIQSSSTTWVELEFSSATPEWVTMHGYLQCTATGDEEDVGNGMAFFSTDNATYEARVGMINVYYGHHESGP